MVSITYIEYGGTEHRLAVAVGDTLMRAAVSNGVRGIDAECGGACACATCHLYIDNSWVAEVGPPSGFEADLLQFAPGRQANSRLGCQVAVTERLNGLIVRIPASQKE